MRIQADVRELRNFARALERRERNGLRQEMAAAVNRAADRHLARCVENTDAGDSPDSPDLRNRWDRSAAVPTAWGAEAEVFNPLEYASYYEYGHRQTPGRIVFAELRPGAVKYGRAARKQKDGRWGIFLRLRRSFVPGRYVMTRSEERAQEELDRAGRRIAESLGR